MVETCNAFYQILVDIPRKYTTTGKAWNDQLRKKLKAGVLGKAKSNPDVHARKVGGKPVGQMPRG